ncbi:MAG: hypothetical protein KC777_17935 [Cyanobacteria bacterium HKST-UBA02]|nr:hypothetical protein [Cyanobacteria bacterium HKST-UBA02]
MAITEKDLTRKDFIEYLTKLVNECLDEAKNLALPVAARTELYSVGCDLDDELQVIVNEQFAEDSEKFVASAKEIERVAKNLKKNLEQLENIAKTFKAIAQILEVAEDVAIIAAGYFT